MTTTSASQSLTQALINLAARGLRAHCSDPGTSELWISDHPGERTQAARLCLGCPVIDPCREAADANDERWHVWGGRDYNADHGANKRLIAKKARQTRRELRWAPS